MHDVSERAFNFSLKALQMDFLLPFNQAKMQMSEGKRWLSWKSSTSQYLGIICLITEEPVLFLGP